MAPIRRRRAAPTSEPALVERVRKSLAQAVPDEISDILADAEKAVATAGDTLSAEGKLAPSQGEVASAIHDSNVPAKPKKPGAAKLEDENGDKIKATATVSPATAPVSFSKTPGTVATVSSAVTRKKVHPDSLEAKALELYVETLVTKLEKPVKKTIEEIWQEIVKYDDSQPRAADGKWVGGDGGAHGAEGSVSAHTAQTDAAGGPKYAMDLTTANALGTALAAHGYTKEQVISHLSQQGFHANGKTAQRVLAAHAKQQDADANVTAPYTHGVPDQWNYQSAVKGMLELDMPEVSEATEETAQVRKSLYCEFVQKADEPDKQLVTGIVLEPEVVDAQADIYDANVIEEAAHKFLAKYNAGSKMGHLHKEFNRPLDLVESYIAPVDFVLKGRHISKGTWMMTVKVKDPSLWEDVKSGKLTGFSIGGVAKVQKLAA